MPPETAPSCHPMPQVLLSWPNSGTKGGEFHAPDDATRAAGHGSGGIRNLHRAAGPRELARYELAHVRARDAVAARTGGQWRLSHVSSDHRAYEALVRNGNPELVSNYACHPHDNELAS